VTGVCLCVVWCVSAAGLSAWWLVVAAGVAWLPGLPGGWCGGGGLVVVCAACVCAWCVPLLPLRIKRANQPTPARLSKPEWYPRFRQVIPAR